MEFELIHKCGLARRGLLKFDKCSVETPVFMPVGTEGAIKGLLPSQVEAAGHRLILGNTYHLGFHPGPAALFTMGGMHRLYCWKNALLTDSGGFQMVSLSKLMNMTEEGVEFSSPVDGSRMLLTPEESMHLQRSIGANIIMQLDDVVPPSSSPERLQEAVHRSTRWLKRAFTKLSQTTGNQMRDQTLFPIIQGGVIDDLRLISINETECHHGLGKAIGGLCGGEQKEDFWRTVKFSTEHLSTGSPTYCMGIGYLTDILVCIAFGVDMFDCVYPTRTARFGNAFTNEGTISLKNSSFECDYSPIEADCDCHTCTNYTRAYLHAIVTQETVGCHLVTVHNLHFYSKFLADVREAISRDDFAGFVREYLKRAFKGKGTIPSWLLEAFAAANVFL